MTTTQAPTPKENEKASGNLDALTAKFRLEAEQLFTDTYGKYGEVTELTKAAFFAGLLISATGNSIAEMKDLLIKNEKAFMENDNKLELSTIQATTFSIEKFLKCFAPLTKILGEV